MKKKIVKAITNQELTAQKEAIVARLIKLFSTVAATVLPQTALIELKLNRKLVGHFHADCSIQTNDGQAYYVCFGYDRVKVAEHPFFIRIEDHWFRGADLIAKDEWFYESLSEVMNIQGRFEQNRTTLRVIDEDVAQAA